MGNSLALGKLSKPHLTRETRDYLHPGMHGRGVYIPDVNASVGFHPLNTSSDVLAIYQEPVRFIRSLPPPV
jgi:hypothetical protein